MAGITTERLRIQIVCTEETNSDLDELRGRRKKKIHEFEL